MFEFVLYYCLLFTTHDITLHIFRTAILLSILRVGGPSAAMLFYQVGSGQGLLHHSLGFFPPVPHDRQFQLTGVLVLCSPELGGVARLRPDLLHHLREAEPVAPAVLAALLQCFPHVREVLPRHVVEGPAVPGLVSREHNPVGTVIHTSVEGHWLVIICHLVGMSVVS